MFQRLFQEIINSLPTDPEGVIITALVAGGIGLGALTALLGALHSRPTMALMMFSLGTILGYVVPAWLGFNIHQSIPIALTGIALGLVGFLLHRWCVAFALGMLVTGVAVVILYDQIQAGGPVSAGQPHSMNSSVVAAVQHYWQTASPTFRTLAPWVALAAFLAAAIFSLILPKFGMAVLYSLGGTIMTLFSIGLGHASDKITWLDSLKNGPMTVAVLGITMLLVGFLAQVGLVYRPGPRQNNQSGDSTQRTPKP